MNMSETNWCDAKDEFRGNSGDPDLNMDLDLDLDVDSISILNSAGQIQFGRADNLIQGAEHICTSVQKYNALTELLEDYQLRICS
jgi:hypothetical protein